MKIIFKDSQLTEIDALLSELSQLQNTLDFPDLAYDDFFVQQPLYSGKKQRSKVDKTKANENSNWVLLPATWRPSVQADADTVEAKNESSEAKISRFGFWVTLKPGMESLRRENSKMQN